MERQSLYERFKLLSWQQQIGNIASTLANISRYADSPTYDELTKLSLREAALAIDWCVPNVPQQFLLDLAMMHRELLAWWQVFPVEPRSLLSLHTRHQSDRLLVMAGLMIGVDKDLQSVDVISEGNRLNGVDVSVVKETTVSV
ncbi:hypothetical protein [Pseudanabaena sp. ABRG5-3]|uniref:hypothetical protein n=1 Tax=Pseudanabaena sp. ABRG5-3 TaxID=685565 RepID=UPI000DC6DEED|nr:hypothetical protein [Pseudanabaena sp. ABRG5-3]BBC26397.1 hypothetical protein ABRG53_4140 [Pseudanabaena sp. ABRG5-3]